MWKDVAEGVLQEVERQGILPGSAESSGYAAERRERLRLVLCNGLWDKPVELDLERKTYSEESLHASFGQCGQQIPGNYCGSW